MVSSWFRKIHRDNVTRLEELEEYCDECELKRYFVEVREHSSR